MSERMSNRLPVGPGSRGGRWHEIEFRRAYHRAWRAANPEYRERETFRRANARAAARGVFPAGTRKTPRARRDVRLRVRLPRVGRGLLRLLPRRAPRGGGHRMTRRLAALLWALAAGFFWALVHVGSRWDDDD
jgi:hypothetical protein